MSELGESAVDSFADRVQTLPAPDPNDAAIFISAAVGRRDLVTIFGRCTVEYDARAASDLPSGDRHVMIKADRTSSSTRRRANSR